MTNPASVIKSVVTSYETREGAHPSVQALQQLVMVRPPVEAVRWATGCRTQ